MWLYAGHFDDVIIRSRRWTQIGELVQGLTVLFIFLYSLMLKIHTLFLQDISLIINQHSFLFKNTRETK